MSFMDLEKVYDRVNREVLWQLLRMYDVDGKLLNGIKSMYVNSLPCIRVKWVESECFNINRGVGQGSIMSSWLFNVYIDAVMEVKMGMERMGARFLDERRLPGHCADDLVLCGESEYDLRAIGNIFEMSESQK